MVKTFRFKVYSKNNCYTVIDVYTGDVYVCEKDSCRIVENVADNFWIASYGVYWRKNCDEKTLSLRVRYAVNRYIAANDLGLYLSFSQTPVFVKSFLNTIN